MQDQANVQNYLKAKVSLEAHNRTIKQLDEKRDSLEALLSELKDKIAKAESQKKEAIDGYLIGENAESAAKQATDQHAQLIADEKNANELLTRVNQKIAELLKLSPGLAQKADYAKQAIWNPISNDLSNKLHDELCNKIWFAYQMNRQKSSPFRFEQFLLQIFPKPTDQRLNEFNSELADIFEKALKS